MDVNLLPDELKKKEEQELKRKAGESLVVPMSAPTKEPGAKPHHLTVPSEPPSTPRPPQNAEESKLPHVREESYIHEVTKEGKIVHAPPPPPPLRRARPSWVSRLLGYFSSGAQRAPSVQPPASLPPPLSKPPQPPAAAKEQLPQPPLPPLQPLPEAPLPPSVKQPSSEPGPKELPKESALMTESAPDMRRAPAAPPAPSAPTQPPQEEKPAADKPKSGETTTAASALGPPALGINLLPPEWSWNLSLTIQFRRRVLLSLALLAVISVVGSFAGRYIYISFQEKHVAAIEEAQKKVQEEIDRYQPQEIEWSNLNNRLKLIAALLKDHIKVTSVFKFLEETVSPMVQYSSFSFNDGKIAVSATTVSYEEMARQIVALRADQARVSAVDVGSYSFDKAKGIVNFNLVITLKPEVWHYGEL